MEDNNQENLNTQNTQDNQNSNNPNTQNNNIQSTQDNNTTTVNSNNQSDFTVNSSEIKTEVKETASEIKQAVKNTNLKKEANAAKNFFSNFFKTPYTEIKKIVESPKSFLKISIIVFVVWVVAELIGSIISLVRSYSSYSLYSTFALYLKNSIRDFLNIFWAILGPAIIIALLSVIIYLFMKNKKKSYLTIMSTIIVAKIPSVLASIVSLLSPISTEISKITGSFSSICSAVSMVLVYFAIKALYNEEDDNKVAKTFLITMSIYYGILLVLKFFNIYI